MQSEYGKDLTQRREGAKEDKNDGSTKSFPDATGNFWFKGTNGNRPTLSLVFSIPGQVFFAYPTRGH
jgi:hypothetical protein